MKNHHANLLNSVTLIIMSLWAYFTFQAPIDNPEATASVTTFIPTILGLILLALNNGLKNENKIVAHLVVLITFLAIGGLSKPFFAALDKNSGIAVFRVGLMLATSILAMITFIRSFIQARKNS
tara:strand:+ start:1626 stop:1997 length:372 start_codon:yes stop_codon:yes gene_type:complete